MEKLGLGGKKVTNYKLQGMIAAYFSVPLLAQELLIHQYVCEHKACKLTHSDSSKDVIFPSTVRA